MGHQTRADCEIGMDLEEYRRIEGLTYEELAERLGVPQSRQALAYARGEMWPGTERLQTILERTGGRVTILAMHQRRLAWLREHGRLRSSSLLVLD